MDLAKRVLTSDEDKQSKRALVLGIVIWFLHLNVAYALASVSCRWTWLSFSVAGVPALSLVEILLTLVAMTLTGGLILVSWRNWRRHQTERPPQNPEMLEDTEKDRRPLLASVVMGSNAFFILFELATLVIILALKPCVGA